MCGEAPDLVLRYGAGMHRADHHPPMSLSYALTVMCFVWMYAV